MTTRLEPGRDTVGFIGLGIMGRPMARNLRAAGYDVVVWNRSRSGIDALVEAGASEASCPRDVAERATAVFTMVGDSPDVEHVALGPGGIIEGAHDGLVHIDMSTISPAVTRAIAERYAEAGVEMLDAPVSGGEQGAIDGTLSIMAAGRRETFDRCLPLFEVLGRKIVYCGPSGAGQTVKLCNQVVVALNNLAMCEALVLSAKAGVPPATMLEAVTAGAGASWALSNLAPRVLQGDFKPGFKVAHQQKDLRLALDLARERALPLPGSALVHQLFASLEAQGLGASGTQALIQVLEQLGDVKVAGD